MCCAYWEAIDILLIHFHERNYSLFYLMCLFIFTKCIYLLNANGLRIPRTHLIVSQCDILIVGERFELQKSESHAKFEHVNFSNELKEQNNFPFLNLDVCMHTVNS